MTRKAPAVLVLFVLASCLAMTAADGAGIYKAKCALCHGAAGVGDTPVGAKFGT